jgi:hypothetical protein
MAATPFQLSLGVKHFHSLQKIPPLIYTSPSDTPSMGTQITNQLLYYTNKIPSTALYTSRSVLSRHISFYRSELDLSLNGGEFKDVITIIIVEVA